jgi:aspartyl-tRNA(Asn)/glutamyl-tRNA(Gln) amidotransferase subunit C
MADLTRTDLLKLAQLARINVSEAEVSEFTEEINAILEYVALLQAVDVEGLEPTSQVTGLVNVTRADVIKDYGYDPAELLKNVPAVQDDQIKVKRMIG